MNVEKEEIPEESLEGKKELAKNGALGVLPVGEKEKPSLTPGDEKEGGEGSETTFEKTLEEILRIQQKTIETLRFRQKALAVLIILLLLFSSASFFKANFVYGGLRSKIVDESDSHDYHFSFINVGLGKAHSVHVNYTIYHFRDQEKVVDYQGKINKGDIGGLGGDISVPGGYGFTGQEDVLFLYEIHLFWRGGDRSFSGSFEF